MASSDTAPVDTVLEKWAESQKRLESALQELYNATSAVDTAFRRHSPDSLEAIKIASTINTHTKSIIDNQKRSIDASTTLLLIRNESAAPINRLPDVILARIFRMVVDLSQPEPRFMRPPVVLSSVCQTWRGVVIHTSRLWRYITFDHGRDTEFKAACLCLGRAHESPLEITFRDVGTNFHYALHHTGVACKLLAPHAARFASFSLDIQHATTLESLLNVWTRHGTPGAVKRVSIKSHQENFDPYWVLDGSSTAEYLWPVRVLKLNNVYVQSDSPAFWNLLELDLYGVQDRDLPTIAELIKILAASPYLHTLKIHHYNLDTKGVAPSPVVLQRLCSLTLEITTGLEELLEAITWPVTNRIYLSVSSADHRTHTSELIARWKMLYPSILRLGPDTDHSLLERVLPRLPNVHTFAYDGRTFHEPMLDILSNMSADSPRFRRIEIATCVIASKEAFRRIITHHNVQRLRLIMCRFVETRENGEKIKVDAKMELDICVWLNETVPDFKIVDNVL